MDEKEFRYKDTTKDTRLIEILRGNLALHRRRARTWPDIDAALQEATSAVKVRERLISMGEEV